MIAKAAWALPLLLHAAVAHADLRCGGNLVTVGDRVYELLSACGEPDLREPVAGPYLPGLGILTAEERWYYNPGPQYLVRIVRIRDGRVAQVDTGGYGFKPEAVAGECRATDFRRGISKLELMARCGEPAYRETRYEVWPANPPRQPFHRVIPVEEWTYDLGPGRFIQVLTLVNGEVRRVESAGRR